VAQIDPMKPVDRSNAISKRKGCCGDIFGHF
jgi:hypothetical protein